MSVVSDIRLEKFPSKHVSFSRVFLDYSSSYGTKEALIDPDTGEKLTFLELPSAVARVQRQLIGIKKGTVIAVVCGNSISILLVYLATIDVGAIIVPVNPASKRYELEKYLDECKVDYVLTEHEYAVKVAEILAQPKFEAIFTIILEDLLKREPLASAASEEPNEEDTAFIFFSSGTTGPPKAIRHNHRTLLAHLSQILFVRDRNSMKYPFPLVNEEDRVHGVLPYFHAGGLITVFCMLIQGATVVVNKKWNEEGFLRILQGFQITTINVVPPIMDFLVKHPLVDSFELKSLKTVFVGAAKCDEVLLRSLKRRLPNLEHVIQLYGLTEAGVLLFVTPVRNIHLSSVGRAMPGVHAKILDEHGDLMKFGEVGRLVVKAPTYMQGYLGEHLAVPYGWFDTGDLACIDDQGFVYITGRTKDMIKVRGWQVNPFEIEEAIKANVVGVKDCAVVGVDHDVDGQRPKAFIVGEPDVNEVINFVKDTFTSYKHLCGVEIVDAIPRTPSGKILRRELVSSIGAGG
ncbi:hypothetical protein V3C99_003776 [Haemonchus contortus]